MREKIQIIIYHENDKVKVKLKDKCKKNASDGVKNLHTLLKAKIIKILNEIK